MAIVTKDLLLEERYPQLSFLLRFFPIKSFHWTEEKRNAVKGDFFLHRPNALQEELKEVFSSFSCCSFETIYIYGIGLGYYYFPLKEWLSKNQERDLVFLEEDLGALSHFLEMEHAEEVLDHPQVHIRFLLDPRKTSSFLRECAKEFPSEKVEVIALESYARHFKKRFQKLRLGLLSASTIEHALFMESLHAHLFFRNLLPNFHLLPQAFLGNAFKGSFQGVPAIICGAGPSLGGAIEELRTLENKALILAGGSSITALSAKGILPHFSLAIDPNEEEYRRLKMASAFEVPLLYGHRVHPLVFSTANSPLGYLHTLSGGAVEIWLEKELGLQPSPLQAGFTIEAMSVTTLAIEFAATLGCNPIILVGVDLAFAGEKMYADGVFPSPSDSSTVSETRIRKKNREGKWVSTLVKWV
ncbi:MAG: DUF115 domain-containing protein, partial [Simkania negevensis]|nr:DUF115 domain-containing protein [Simkania negevensis]